MEKNIKSTVNKDRLIQTFGEEAAIKISKSKGESLENYIARHGEQLGNEKWQLYLSKRKAAYKKKRDDGHVYPKYNREYFHMLHGVEKGDEIYNKKIAAQAYKVSLKY